MSSLTNTIAPVQDTISDLASYCRLVDFLTDADYTGSGVGHEHVAEQSLQTLYGKQNTQHKGERGDLKQLSNCLSKQALSPNNQS